MRVKGRELRYQAAIRGWDQRGLAEAAGVSQATVSRAMAGGQVHRTTLL
jgi:transcriptional regulator with XRE-family HTH domain